jgi:hypothetical protein
VEKVRPGSQARAHGRVLQAGAEGFLKCFCEGAGENESGVIHPLDPGVLAVLRVEDPWQIAVADVGLEQFRIEADAYFPFKGMGLGQGLESKDRESPGRGR